MDRWHEVAAPTGIWPSISVGGIDFPTYFLFTSFAFCVCLLWLIHRSERRGFSRNSAIDLALVVGISGLIGSRAFHIFFEEPAYYRADFWRVIELWRGGFVWYGGALLAAPSGYIWLKKGGQSVGRWLDLTAPVLALGYALGRVACLTTGCCYGDICEYWPRTSFRYPTQGFAVAWESLLVIALLQLEKMRKPSVHDSLVRRWFSSRYAGSSFVVWLFLHALGRILMELMRGDDRGPEPFGVSISTWISAVILFGTVAWVFRKTAQARSRAHAQDSKLGSS